MVQVIRDALVVGINRYDSKRLRNFHQDRVQPARDAQAIARCLKEHGGFNVRLLPEVVVNGSYQVSEIAKVSLPELRKALEDLFRPAADHVPETALFYFSGHGLRDIWGGQREGYLATSDVDPDRGFYGLALSDLRLLLENSPIKQQIVWLDCCHSGEFFNIAADIPSDQGQGRDRCFIAASREFEEAYSEIDGDYSVLTGALLRCLQPEWGRDGWVSNQTLVSSMKPILEARPEPQRAICVNAGNPIILTGEGQQRGNLLSYECPYKGLQAFSDRDSAYFYGRKALTNDLLDRVRQGNFVAVVGASGSGKSSLIKAGLLHQLRQDQSILGSDRWQLLVWTPGENPLQRLAAQFDLQQSDVASERGVARLIDRVRTLNTQRIVLVLDQFEEVFTLCQDVAERQQLFRCLLELIKQTDHKLYLILVLRTDFLSKVEAEPDLATYIDQYRLTVRAMTEPELTEAIVEPAKKAGLEVQHELVREMLNDVKQSPGSLPLLQFTLTELWEELAQRQFAERLLMLSDYQRLGKIAGTLERRANETYEQLASTDAQTIAKRIFLELTHIPADETTDVTKQPANKEALQSIFPDRQELVSSVIDQLASARLVVFDEIRQGDQSTAIVEIAHESLIRNWSLLKEWVQESRTALPSQRKIQSAAIVWSNQQQSPDFLLQKANLVEAESYLQTYADTIPLSPLALELIKASQEERDRLQREQEEQRQREYTLLQERMEQEKKARKAAQRMTWLTIASAIIFVVLGGGFWKARSDRQVQEILALGADGVPDPRLLPAARSLLTRVDQLSRSDDEKATEESMRNARAVMNYMLLLKPTISGKDCSKLQKSMNEIDRTFCEAEDKLVKLIAEKRLPKLREQLANGEIGRKKLYIKTEFENQYEGTVKTNESALATTYKILRRSYGAKADVFESGELSTDQQVNRMPCQTLEQIERIWKEKTGCSWSQSCPALYDPFHPKERLNLADAIFDPVNDKAIDRLRNCGLNAE